MIQKYFAFIFEYWRHKFTQRIRLGYLQGWFCPLFCFSYIVMDRCFILSWYISLNQSWLSLLKLLLCNICISIHQSSQLCHCIALRNLSLPYLKRVQFTASSLRLTQQPIQSSVCENHMNFSNILSVSALGERALVNNFLFFWKHFNRQLLTESDYLWQIYIEE